MKFNWRTFLSNEYLMSVVVLFILGTIYFAPLLIGSHVFMGGDSQAPIAMRQGIEAAQQEYGEYPLWHPWVFSGLPTVHSFINISHFYLPHYLFAGPMKLGVPRFWIFLAHYVFAGLGVVVLLRTLGTGKIAALLGGAAYMTMPYMITMSVHGHGSQMMTAAYIPWVIWALWRLHQKPGLFNTGLLSLFLGLQLQRAHVQVAYYTWMLAGLFLIIKLACLIIQRHWKNWIGFGYTLVAMIVGLGVSLNIYIPVLNYTPYSIRGAGGGGGTGFEYATQWSFSWGEMMTFLVPSFYGFGGVSYWGSMPFTDYPNYMGIVILALAIWGLIRSKGVLRIWLAAAIVLSLLLSFGKNFGLYQLFYNHFPYFNKFRAPMMILILTQFCTAVLGGLGLNKLIKTWDDEKTGKWLQILLASCGAIGLVLLVFGGAILKQFNIPPHQYAQVQSLRLDLIHQDTVIVLLIMLVAVGLAVAVYRRWLPQKWGLIAIVILSLADLGFVNWRIINPSPESYRSSTLQKSTFLKAYLRPDEIIRFLQQDESKFRVLPLGQLQGDDRFAAFMIESLSGYHPAKLANYNSLLSSGALNSFGVLQMLNVKYLLSSEPITHPAMREVFQGRYFFQGQYIPVQVYQFSDFLPRIFPVSKLSLQSNSDDIDILNTPGFDPVKDSFVNEVKYAGEWDISKTELTLDYWSPNEIRVSVKSEEPQFLLFSEVYYPAGWQATIGNVPVTIAEVNGVLRGVPIPVGEQEVVLRFAPEDLRDGRLASMFSLLLIAVFLGIPLVRRK